MNVFVKKKRELSFFASRVLTKFTYKQELKLVPEITAQLVLSVCLTFM